MKKIGIATVYTGYNYGSALQAFATKHILSGMGYEAQLLKLSGSITPGRDIRIMKLLTILFRAMLHAGGVKNLKNYKDSVSKKLPEQSATEFHDFFEKYLDPTNTAYAALRRKSKTEEYTAFLCGSDQVWNSAVFYVDPFYYLRFAPLEKRIAFAPSFGRDYIPDYNRKKIAKYISEMKCVSVRETSGAQMIKQLVNRDAVVLLDPTLLLNAEEWTSALALNAGADSEYLLAYFLDKPSSQTVEKIKEIGEKEKLKIVCLPYAFEDFAFGRPATAGPCKFVEYIKNAKFVCTDSFHGTAFSLNFNIPFYTFERNYKNAGKQSARIESLLEMTKQTDRYEPEDIEKCMDISFEKTNCFFSEERIKAREYLINAISGAEESYEQECLLGREYP